MKYVDHLYNLDCFILEHTIMLKYLNLKNNIMIYSEVMCGCLKSEQLL